MPNEPRVIADRYEIIELIARGGMSEVFLAQDRRLSRPVAIKILAGELSRDPSFVERFRREAQDAGNLSHANIVSVFDWGQDGETSFIVMEYIDGRSVRNLIDTRGHLDDIQVAGIGGEIAAALSSAHASGVVHRDIKPANILISTSGKVKVTDFGIAHASSAGTELTRAGSVMGTATYFSPEQAQGLAVDARSDVYSLGIVLYEMSTGTPPFSGDSPVAIAYQQVQDVVPPPSTRNPAIAAGLEKIILTALEKNPDDRYATADDMRADLLRFRRGDEVIGGVLTATGVNVPTTLTPAVAAVGVGAAGAAARPRQEPRGRNRGTIISVSAIIAVLILVLGGLLISRIGSQSTGGRIDVPDVTNLLENAAKSKLEGLGFKVTSEESSSTLPKGQVFAQDPEGGTLLAEGESVNLRVSAGLGKEKVPPVEGKDAETARADLNLAGFKSVEIKEEASETIAAGLAIRTTPAAGRAVVITQPITLFVSLGKPKVAVPQIAQGLTLSDAITLLKEAGLTAQAVLQPSDTVAKDRVIATDPPGGTEVDKGSVVKVLCLRAPS
ncbi:MAG: Stk1 family PASTA domain-containing Ser/Thr kinase [Acidimicrobiia bacterium]|nr:Stk1 family PASTA domain-containing Ser/Thr kinase [Acidimicrobiia bacterium]